MDAGPHRSSCRECGAALIIVLAFVVLLTFLVVAYLSRTTSDRQVTQVSFNQTKVDQVAASAMELIIGGLRQEITGPNPTPTPPYLPAATANMLPLRSGNPGGVPDPIPNLVRRSVYPDPIPAPGITSLASALNSAPVDPANPKRGEITLARWNKHYLIPKADTSNDKSDPVVNFTAPDWVILTRNGPVAFAAWDPTLADAASTNNNYAVGRYAYAIYDEGGLLDANVAGYPSGTTPDQAGRKGPVAFADLAALPSPSPNPPSPYFPNSTSPYQVDRLVGWRNYGSTQPNNNFPNVAPAPAFAANFRAGSAPALAYWKSIINNTSGFTSTSGAVAANGRTDQMFLSRQQLLAYRAATLFNVNALQYLGTFLRELNAPSWKPSTPTGSTIDYATLANTPTADTSTAINRDLLKLRAIGTFTRFDGTTATVGDLLLKQRFPLSRLAWITYKGPSATLQIGKDVDPSLNSPNTSDPIIIQLVANGVNLTTIRGGTAANIKTCFGLTFPVGGVAGDPWTYTNPTGASVATRILRLDEVAAANREPDFFELLKAGILSGSVGVGSGNVRTFVNSEGKYYDTTNNLSSDYQIMQIGTNIIDQWDPDNVPTFIDFFDTTGNYRLAGIENLPYLNKLVFKPLWTTVSGKAQFAAWLFPSLWNPHQNAALSTGKVRIAMPTTTQSMTAVLTDSGTPSSLTSSPISGSSNQYMTVDASLFGTSPSAPTSVVDTGTGSSITKNTQSPDLYYGFRYTFATNLAVTASNSSTAYPDFGASGCDFEMQVQVNASPIVFKPYQKWKGCGPLHPLIFAPPASSYWTQTNLQDPEFVTLDPRTVRFGVWGNAGNQSTVATDYTSGVLTTMDQSVGPPPLPGVFEKITALPPNGTRFSGLSTPPYSLYLYANNADTTVHYTDLDGPAAPLQRQGDLLTAGMTTAMQPADFADRPQILNRPFQSVAELGQVFRDQPWKTLDFTTAASADAGLLDIFTLHESSMEAGKTSLNTRQKPILTAILSQATRRLTDPGGTTAITSAQRDAIVNALFTITSAQPMIRKTDLLAQLAADPSVTGLGNKEARELVMRAFSDACQTRTWNLMIDVVAQSGRYPPNASTLAGFLVEGEQHYWVHVAIDRFTGQVIDKQIEVVNE
jgi:hypothetical protein